MAQTTIWIEDFNSYSNNTGIEGSNFGNVDIGDYPASVTKWTIDASGATLKNNLDYLKIPSNEFHGRDINGVGIWLSETINISSYSDVSISADFRKAGGGMESNDSINFYYSLDGGNWTAIALLNDDISGIFQNYSVSNINGNNLYLKVEIILPDAGGAANAEIYAFDNVLVEEPVPPSCTTPISPTNTETDVAVDVTLSWNTAPLATGYKIYFGTDAGATNIENGTELGNVTSYTPAADLDFLTDYYWKIVPYNSIGTASGCSIWSFTSEDIRYCIPNYTTGTNQGDYISLVQLGNINNSTGASSSPYYNYYNTQSTDIQVAQNYTITIGCGTYTSGNNISVWIDFNANGDFAATEKLGNVVLNANQTGTINFAVPAGATTGVTRMRVRESWNTSAMDPCTEYNYGETEDYNVNIVPNCTDATLTLNTANSTQSVCEVEPIGDIEYTIGGDATGATLSGPGSTGLTGVFNSGTYTISGMPTTTGSYLVTTTGTPSGCSEATATGLITINQLPNAPTANNNTSTYNGAEQTASATVGSGETVQWFTSATGSSSTTAPTGTDVGTYTAWAEAINTSTGCVSATRTQITLIINKKDLQVTATAPDISYGDAEPTVTVQYSGFEGTDNASVLDNTGFTLGTTYTQGDPIGTYSTSIVIGTASDNNYTFNPLSSSNFLVGNNVLTVTAGNQTVSYGTHEGQITQNGTYTITGFLNGDNSSVITGLNSISFTSNYTQTTNVGTSGITITPDITGLSAANYTFTSISGDLTIEKADQYISFSNFLFTVPLNSFDTVEINVTSSSGLPVLITLASGSAATLNYDAGKDPPYFLTNIGTTGFVTLDATQAGNANYNAAIPESQTFDVTKSNQNISFPAIDDLSFYNGLTMDMQAVASSGLTIDYTVVSGPATVVGNTLTISGVGVVWVRASQIGDASYNAASDVTQLFTVTKGTQTITINVPAGTIDETTAITATSTSGLPVTLTLGAGSDATTFTGTPGGSYTLSGIGSNGSGFIYILGNQAGNVNFFSANQVLQTIDLSKSNQTITFPAVGNKTYGDAPVTLSATATSGLALSYTLVSGPAILAGNVLTINGVGTVVVEASQAGDPFYNPAPTVTQQFEVVKATPVITQADIVKIFEDGAFTITPTSPSTGSYSFISGDDEVFTISGNTATITGAGITVLDISQEPTTNYYGTTLSVIFTVNKAASTVSMTGATAYNYDGTNQGPETSSVTGSTGTVTYSYEGTAGTTYGPSTLKPINAGTYTATATVVEDDNYFGATSTPHNFTISKVNAIISITPYSVNYDGVGHIAIGTAKGVSAEDLIGLDLSGTIHTNAGTYIDSWTFTDVTGNYNDDSGTISNVINQSGLSITASNQSKCFGTVFTFNGTEFTSTDLIGIETIGTVTLTSTGTPSGALAGTHAITPSGATGGTFNPGNYNITYVDGELVVSPLPTLTGASQDAPFCEGNTATINLSGLVAGSTFTIAYSIDNFAQTPITGLLADGSGNSSFSTPVLTAANDGQVLQVTGITITSESPSCSETFTQDINLRVDPLPTLGGVSQASVCDGSAAIINLTGLVPDSTFSINYSINDIAQTPITGLTADGIGESSFATQVLTTANNGQSLQIIQIEDESSGCIQTFTETIILAIDPITVGGTATATDASICENSGTTIELMGYTGTIQWQQSADGTTGWSNVTGGSGATTDTYSTPGLASTTYYRAVVTSGNCVSENSTTTSVTVDLLPTLGGVSQAATVCEGSSATINLSGLLPNTTFTLEYTINGGSLIVLTGLTANGTGNSSFTTPVLTINNDGETLQIDEIEIESSGCVQRFIQNLILDVDPISEAGTASADQNICSGDTPADITLTGNVGSIQWQSSPYNSIWTIIPGATGTTLTSAQMGSLSATTYYRAVVTSGVCSPVNSSAVTVNVESTPVAGSYSKTPNTSAVCDGEDVSATLTVGSGGNGTDELEISTNGGANWSPYTSGTNISTTGLTEVQIRTRRVADYCTPSAYQTVSWNVNPSAGITLDSNTTQSCYGDGSALLSYSAISGGANRYSINYEDIDIPDVSDAVLPDGTITLIFPVDKAPGSYDAVLTVNNSTSGCTSENYNISIVINPVPATGEIIPD